MLIVQISINNTGRSNKVAELNVYKLFIFCPDKSDFLYMIIYTDCDFGRLGLECHKVERFKRH